MSNGTVMANLDFPARVTVRLLTWSGEPFRYADILVSVRTFARHKNDFYLGPYPTNADGISAFTREDLQADVEATYDSGLMDYAAVEECYPLVELSLSTPDEIARALKARTETWTSLLAGENRRWRSIDELQSLYRRAFVATQPIAESSERHIRDEWTDPAAVLDYAFHVLQNRVA